MYTVKHIVESNTLKQLIDKTIGGGIKSQQWQN